jgi:hypothetical protein
MDTITRSDIVSNETYEARRDAARQEVLAHKAIRRVDVGDLLTVMFETRETMIYQVQEMMRTERLSDEVAIGREIEVYNGLVPRRNQFSATVFIAVTTDEEVRLWLPRLIGVDECLALEFGGHTVAARSEPGRNRADKTSAVHYIWFDFSPEEAAAFIAAPGAALVCSHEHYRQRREFARDSFVALRDDLSR